MVVVISGLLLGHNGTDGLKALAHSATGLLSSLLIEWTTGQQYSVLTNGMLQIETCQVIRIVYMDRCSLEHTGGFGEPLTAVTSVCGAVPMMGNSPSGFIRL